MCEKKKLVIIGGGIAGTTCLSTLIEERDDDNSHFKSIILISESRLIKRVKNYRLYGRNLEHFDIETREGSDLFQSDSNNTLGCTFLVGRVKSVNSKDHTIVVSTSKISTELFDIKLDYDILCLCNGSSPIDLSLPDTTCDEIRTRIFTLRDTKSLEILKEALKTVEKVVVIGNGGIAMEVVNKLINCDITWIVRDGFIGCSFLDSNSSKFLLQDRCIENLNISSSSNLQNVYSSTASYNSHNPGPALGKDWSQDMSLLGALPRKGSLEILYNSEPHEITFNESIRHPISISVRNQTTVGCDLIISAIGVKPNVISFENDSPSLSPSDGGILIDHEMRTSVESIYAAGDVASCEDWSDGCLWFQMRLWTQARQMGFYCAKCILAHTTEESPAIYSNFECFTHVTSFFGYKLVLLGKYNAQFLSENTTSRCEALIRNKKQEYIKLLLLDDRVIGAILLGDTNLEETIENLIHDQTDISGIKYHILDETIDLEDYFD